MCYTMFTRMVIKSVWKGLFEWECENYWLNSGCFMNGDNTISKDGVLIILTDGGYFIL